MKEPTSATQEATSVQTPGAPSPRLLSLDVFRGITIAGMILVNNPGSWSHIYPPLEHAAWHGWTPTDLIFPFFLFIIGVAMPYSFSRRLAQGKTKGALALHVIYRSSVLIALGMLLTGIPTFDYSHKLFLDVLQRIGVIYLISGLLYLVTRPLGQAITTIACLVIYWLLMFLVPVPGYGAGVLAPDGNVWQYVDNLLIAGWHYHAEGVLSIIPSISTVLLGALTGFWLRLPDRSAFEKATVLFVAGNVGLVLGLILDAWFPINKLLWSSSYVLFTAGFALNLFGVCYWLLDIKGIRGWATPFVIFGMNAITVFFLSGLMAKFMEIWGIQAPVYQTLFASWLSPINASLAFAVCYVLLWLGVMTVLYKKRVFIKI